MQPSSPSPRVELEAAIAANLDDPAPYLIYADWLQAHGDPQGEVIVLAHAGKTAAAAQLVSEHRMLGGLADLAKSGPKRQLNLYLTWHMGFVRTVSIGWDAYLGRNYYDALDDLTMLLELPIARFVRSLEIGPVPPSRRDKMSFDGFLERLAEVAMPSTLASLKVGEIGNWPLHDTSAGPFDGVLRAYPSLRSLTVHAGDVELGRLEHGELRTLDVRTYGLSIAALTDLGHAQLPRLEALELQLGQPNRGASPRESHLAPLLASDGFPALRHLRLLNLTLTDEVIWSLASSRMLTQLETLDLRSATLTDDRADTIVELRDRFAHLACLDLGAFTPHAQRRLAGVARRVNFGVADDWVPPPRRYVPAVE